jgi:hypothetical protein
MPVLKGHATVNTVPRYMLELLIVLQAPQNNDVE